MSIKTGLKHLEKEYGKLSFAKVLWAHRMGEDMGQVEMATKLGISKQSLCDLEKGRRIPSPRRASDIAKKLKILPESFIQLALQDQLRKEKLNYRVDITKLKKAS